MALRMWCETGMSINEFWDLSILEFNYAIRGYQRRNKRKEDLTIVQAFYTSRWVWAKRLKLEDILKSTEPKKPMTDEAMMKMCLALNKLYGGEVIRDGN